MQETCTSGSEGGGTEFNRFSLPLSRPMDPHDLHVETAHPSVSRCLPVNPCPENALLALPFIMGRCSYALWPQRASWRA